MSAHHVPGDSNAVKPKVTRKYLHRPRWGGGSWRTERAAKHKRKQQHTRPHIRGKTGAGHQNVDVTARLGKKTRLRLYRALHDATFMTVAKYNANLQKGVKLAIFDVFARRRNGATVTENAVREHTQCDSMPARRRGPKEEGSLAIAAMLGKYPALWVPCLLLAAAALMVLVPPQMVTEARAASNNSLPVLGRAPSFVSTGTLHRILRSVSINMRALGVQCRNQTAQRFHSKALPRPHERPYQRQRMCHVRHMSR